MIMIRTILNQTRQVLIKNFPLNNQIRNNKTSKRMLFLLAIFKILQPLKILDHFPKILKINHKIKPKLIQNELEVDRVLLEVKSINLKIKKIKNNKNVLKMLCLLI